LRKGIRKAVEFVNPYVPGKTIEEVKATYGLDEIIKLGSNENPYGPFTNARKAMINEVDEVYRYPDNIYEKLKKLLAKNNGLTSNNVAISHGAGGMLETLAKTFIETGDEVIIPKQTYGLYKEISKVMGGLVVYSELDNDYKINIDDMIEKITDRTKLIWLCNPNNPTGTTMEAADIEKLVNVLPESAWIIMDEAYSEFMSTDKKIDTLKYIKEGANMIIVRTLSKAYGLAGVRIGYALAQEDMIATIDTVAEPFNANRIGLAGAIATIEEDREEYNQVLRQIVEDREKLQEQLKDLGLTCIPTQTNFVFFETGMDASIIGEKMLQKGVIVRPCGGWSYPQAIRVTIGTKSENQKFIDTLKSVLNEMR